MAVTGAVIFTFAVCFASIATEVRSNVLSFRQSPVYHFDQVLEAARLGSLKLSGNALVDEIIKLAKPELAKEEKLIHPPDFSGSIKKRIKSFLSITVHYHGYDGKIAGLTSLYRSGDVQVNMKNNNLTLEVGLGLHTASISYTIHISSHILKMTKRATITVSGIAVEAKISKDISNVSSPTLDEVKVTNVGKGHCHISGLGILSGLVDKVTSKIFNEHEKALAQKGEETLRKILSKALAKLKF